MTLDDLFRRLHQGGLLSGVSELAVEMFVQQGVDYLLEYMKLALSSWKIEFVSKHVLSNTMKDYRLQYGEVLRTIETTEAEGYAELPVLSYIAFIFSRNLLESETDCRLYCSAR